MLRSDYCVCQSHITPQKHHLFRKWLRWRWEQVSVNKIWLFWVNKEGREISTRIPIDSYVRICPTCHKLCHPENIEYHLNELVVQNMEEK